MIEFTTIWPEAMCATDQLRQAITAAVGTPDAELVHLMNEHFTRHIPLLDEHEQVVDDVPDNVVVVGVVARILKRVEE